MAKASKKTANKARSAAKHARTMQATNRLLNGATAATAAREAGITPRQLYRDMQEPAVQQAIASLYSTHNERIGRLFERTLDVIEDGLQAKNLLQKPDHQIRLKAAAEFRHILDIGQRFGAPQGPTSGALPQWEEFRVIVAEYRRSQAQTS